MAPPAQLRTGLGEKEFGPDHPTIAALLNNLAVLCKAQGKHTEPGSLYRQARAIGSKERLCDTAQCSTSSV